MASRRDRFGKTAVRIALCLAATVTMLSCLQTASATPDSDAQDAITAAWQAAGGDDSHLGAPKGDAHPAGVGFAQDFAGGTIFYTPETGAKALYGAILDEYNALGGAATGGLGFPNSDEVAGLVPDSRLVTFSGADKPLIYWTAEHGAHVVRGPINAAWDKLGSSTGALGVPVEDENYDGSVVTQKFSKGQLSFDGANKTFTTEPPELAEQLSDLQVQLDPMAAIDQVWRAAGGPEGPLGAKQDAEQPIGADGVVQAFAGGKVYFSPATGASAVQGDVLSTYESLGGPAGSDLGFPITSTADGPISGSKFNEFAADDEPVIFFSPGNGAFVVRSAMKVAWDKLEGASGKLGAPVGDQSVTGDVVSQKFSGGSISWNQATNTFSTSPADLAKALSGLQIPGMNLPNGSSSSLAGASGHESQRNWLWVVIPVAVLTILGLLAAAVLMWQRRRPVTPAARPPIARSAPTEAITDDDSDDDEQWAHRDYPERGAHEGTVRLPSRYGTPSVGAGSFGEPELPLQPPSDAPWLRYDESRFDDSRFDDSRFDDARYDESRYDESRYDEPRYEESRYGESRYEDSGFDDSGYGESSYGEARYGEPRYADSDVVRRGEPEPDDDETDTAPTRVVADDDFGTGRHSVGHATSGSEWHSYSAGPQPHMVGSGAVTTDGGAEQSGHPVMHLPLDDPYQQPSGYPIKANIGSGFYYTPQNVLYEGTAAEIWFATEEAARLNGFTRAD